MTTQTKTTWRKVKIGDLVSPVSESFNFKNRDKIIFLNTSDVENGHVLNHTETAISNLPGQAKKKIKRGDILYSEIRPKNKHVARVNFDAKDYVVSTKLMVLRPNEKFSADFTYLALMAPRTINDFQTIAESRSGTFPQITFDAIKDYEVSIPNEYTKQQSIVDILSAFDDKIELNNKINETLEQMAQAIFKEWFVNFKFPGYEKVKMVDSELGKIPEGWEIETLGGIVASITDRYLGDNRKARKPYVPIDVISTKKLALENVANPEEAQSSLIQFREDDILFGAMRAYFHKVAVAPFDGLTRTTCFVLRPFEREYWGFAVMLLFSNEAVGYATSHSGGTTIPYAKWNRSFDSMSIVKPPKEIAQNYYEIFSPLISRIKILAGENKKLAALRDLLLPKLMRGEMRVF